jgi:hypothetical protein
MTVKAVEQWRPLGFSISPAAALPQASVAERCLRSRLITKGSAPVNPIPERFSAPLPATCGRMHATDFYNRRMAAGNAV